MSTPIYLCGHIDGIDCGSGQQVTYDLATLDKSVALAHAKKWAGSWITEGFYKEMPCAELAKVLSALEVAQVEAASRKLDNEQLASDLTALRARLETLRTAAKDMLSTYRHDDKTVLVSAERQEAWQCAVDQARAALAGGKEATP